MQVTGTEGTGKVKCLDWGANPTSYKTTRIQSYNPSTESDMADKMGHRTYFSEDTVRLKSDLTKIGVIDVAWHELDGYLDSDDDDNVIAAVGTSEEALRTFQETAHPPRHYHILSFVIPSDSTLLVHESQLTLLDRAFSFGDVVKRHATDAMSGVVINHGMKLKLRHCFAEDEVTLEDAPAPPQTSIDSISTSSSRNSSPDNKRNPSPSSPRRRKKPCIRPDERRNTWSVKDVPDDEVTLAMEWEEGDYVIWKSSWLGIVEEVIDDVAVRLPNGSVVIPEECSELEIPCIPTSSPVKSEEDEMDWQDVDGFRRKQPETIIPERLTVGQQVTTTKLNLRRGRWIYGAYDPSVTPIGMVVEVRTRGLSVHWVCQNMMVRGHFEPMERPPYDIEEEDIQYIRKFRRACRGQNTPITGPIVCAQAGLEVGDRVRFRDLGEAVKKYDGRSEAQGGLGNGKVVKMPREQQLGYDVNTFVVEDTQTWVEVQWQDFTKTTELAVNLIPYHNIDDHDIWPGDFVLLKPDESDSDSQLNTKHVGVIQSVDAKERIAKIRWFEDPQLQLVANSVGSGSATGKLKEEEEEVSMYDVIAHEAVGLSLGDIVLVAPDRSVSAERSEQSQSQLPPPSGQNEMRRAGATLRILREQGLLVTIAASMASSGDPRLQEIAQMISNPERLEAIQQVMDHPSEPSNFIGVPADWIGEVIDKGLDGLITVRLGGLDQVRDVRVPVEKLFLVIPDDAANMYDYEEDDESERDGSDSDATASGWSERSKILDEEVTYEGGERIPDDGGDEAWSTDDEDGSSGDDDKTDEDFWDWRCKAKEENHQPTELKEGGTLSTDVKGEEEQYKLNTGARSATSKDEDTLMPLAPPGQPAADKLDQNHPAPQQISLTGGNSEDEKGPPPFSVLEGAPASDHAFIGKTRNLPASTLRRLTKEHKILSTSLPKGVIVRTWESRLDLLRVLIIGPMNTPYELAPFIFDFQITEGFPSVPPEAFFHSWTNGLGRINPNLYEDGKICLSLLGTWHAHDRCEGWTTESSLLQVIVSLVGLVLVREPYYNEAGYDIYVGTAETQVSSEHYSERAYILSRGFVKRVLVKRVLGMEEEIGWLYGEGEEVGGGLGLLRQVVESARWVVARSEGRRKGKEKERERENVVGVDVEVDELMETEMQGEEVEARNEGVGTISAGGLILLKRHLSALEKMLEKGVSMKGREGSGDCSGSL